MANYEQQLLDAGVSQDFINAERSKGKSGLLRGVNVDKQDYNPILSAWQNINPNQVFSASNINSTVNNPATLDLNDLQGIRNRLMEDIGYTTAQTNAQAAIDALRQFDLQSAQQQQAIGGRLVPLEVMRGEQRTASETASLERQGYALSAQAKTDLLSALGQELNTRFGIYEKQRDELTNIMVNNPGAGVTYTDTIESATKKINKYNEKVAKEAEEQAKKEAEGAYKKQLQATAMELGISTKTSKGGTRSIKQLEEAIAKENKSALDRAKKLQDLQYQQALKDYNKVSSGVADTSIQDYMKQEQQLYSDVDNWKAKMSAGNASWSDAWLSIQRKYGFDPNNQEDVGIIDSLLGFGYREKYDK